MVSFLWPKTISFSMDQFLGAQPLTANPESRPKHRVADSSRSPSAAIAHHSSSTTPSRAPTPHDCSRCRWTRTRIGRKPKRPTTMTVFLRRFTSPPSFCGSTVSSIAVKSCRAISSQIQLYGATPPNRFTQAHPVSRRSFLRHASIGACACSVVPTLDAAESTGPIIDIHQHVHYHGRSSKIMIAHQRAMGISKTILLPAGQPKVRKSTRGGRSTDLPPRSPAIKPHSMS